jgi:hypothetical protein
VSTVVVTAIALAGLLVVFFALWRDAPLDDPGPRLPDWDPLPSRRDLAAVDWPLRVPGYDPATVDQRFELLSAAYADLLAEADPAAIERAKRRAARRLAQLRGEAGALRGDDAGGPPQVPDVLPGPRPGSIGAVGTARAPVPPGIAPAPEEDRERSTAGAEAPPEPAHRPDPVQATLQAQAILAAIPEDRPRD